MRTLENLFIIGWGCLMAVLGVRNLLTAKEANKDNGDSKATSGPPLPHKPKPAEIKEANHVHETAKTHSDSDSRAGGNGVCSQVRTGPQGSNRPVGPTEDSESPPAEE